MATCEICWRTQGPGATAKECTREAYAGSYEPGDSGEDCYRIGYRRLRDALIWVEVNAHATPLRALQEHVKSALAPLPAQPVAHKAKEPRT